jgi:phosphoribosyl-ATP pyrophosphohydrolase/phosphoribosyl-AMP cyclohydrolase
LQKTEQEGKVTFYSRSKQRLWTKGETSGNYLTFVKALIDCDNDTILIKAKSSGPVCHTGADTCFNEENKSTSFIYELEKIIEGRKVNPSSDSYISGLFKKGINKIAQKVGEEAVELVIEAKDNNITLFKNEAADLLFHYLILLKEKDVSFNEVVQVLQERHEAKPK